MNIHSDGNMERKTVLYGIYLASAASSKIAALMRLQRVTSRGEAGSYYNTVDQTYSLGDHLTLYYIMPMTDRYIRPRVQPKFSARSRTA